MTRVWHRLREEPVDISVDLTFTSGGTGITDLVSSIATDVAQTPRDASVSVVDGEVTFVHSRPGHALGANIGARSDCRRPSMRTSLRSGLPVRTVKPRVPDAKIGKTIVVDRTTNELYLYDGFELEKSYHVATAAAGYITPPASGRSSTSARTRRGPTPLPTRGARTCRRSSRPVRATRSGRARSTSTRRGSGSTGRRT